MQTRRRLSGVLAALTTAAVLVAGCSSGDSGSDIPSDLPDAATLLSDSAATTKTQQSVHLVLAVAGVVTGLPIDNLTGDLTNTPAVAAQGNAKILMGGSSIQVDFVVIDGQLYGAFTPGDWGDGPLGPAADIYDVSVILNPDSGLSNILANFTDPKVDGIEDIGGVSTARITGNVAPDAVNAIAPKLGATEPVPGTAWVAVDGDHQLAQAKLEPSPGNTITMTTSEWGKPVTVVAPV